MSTTPIDFSRLGPRRGAKVAIAGGCGGIGRALVHACVDIGLRVAVLDLPASLERHPPPIDALALQMNGVDESSVLTAFGQIERTWGGLDHLFFLIGFAIVPPVPLDEVGAAQWDEILGGNLRSAFLVSRASLPLLRASGNASIVNVASGLGINVLKGWGAYGSAKAGLIGLTKALAIENAPLIRANAVAPSAILTAFMGGGTARSGEDKSWNWFAEETQRYIPTIPMGRLAVVEDVVGAILFLASDAASFITGQTLHVNGGRFMP